MDSDDEAFFAAVDEAVAQHNQGKTQRPSQPSSPPHPPQPRGNGALNPAWNPPHQQGNGLGGRPPQGAAAPHQQQQRQQQQPQQQQQQQQWQPAHLPPPRGPAAPLAGHVSVAAAELRQQQQHAAAGPSAPPATGQTPAQLQAQVAQLQSEHVVLQRQLAAMGGTNQVLKDHLQRTEGEMNALKKRLQQFETRQPGGVSGGSGPAAPPASGPRLAAYTAAEVQRQLESLRQELAFKTQEAEDAQRRAADGSERVRQAEAAARKLEARLRDQDAQQRQQPQQQEGPATSARAQSTAAAPPLAQQQRSAAATAAQRTEGGAVSPEARLLPGPFSKLALSGGSGSGAPGSGLVARLWATQGESISALISAAARQQQQQQQPLQQHLALTRLQADPAHAPSGRGGPAEACLLQKLQQVARQEVQPVSLLADVLSTVAAALERQAAAPADAATAAAGDVAGPALQLAAQLVREDAGCRAAAVASCSDGAAAAPAASGRIRFSGQPAGAGLPGQAPAAEAPIHLQQVWQQMRKHAGLYAGLGSGMLALALAGGVALGPHHASVLAGGLAAVAALAEGMPAGCAPGRLCLEPVLTSGAMALFLRPTALRPEGLRLLQLMLGDSGLLATLQASLACEEGDGETGPGQQAAITRAASSGRSDPLATRGDSMVSTHQRPANGPEPMQLDRPAAGSWAGARGVVHALLDSLTLDGEGAGEAGAAHHATDGSPAVSPSALAAARAAMQAVAALREQGAHGLLHALVTWHGGQESARGLLPQRLLALAEAAVSQGGEDSSVALLAPSAPPVEREATRPWQQRLRVAQEALTLLRGLVADESTGVTAIEELTCTSAATRLSLVALGKLSRVEAPADTGASLPLAAWALAIGTSSTAATLNAGPGRRGELVCCSAEDTAYMARSLRHRVLYRLQQEH